MLFYIEYTRIHGILVAYLLLLTFCKPFFTQKLKSSWDILLVLLWSIRLYLAHAFEKISFHQVSQVQETLLVIMMIVFHSVEV